jgi:hypothetical protein
MKRWLRKHWLWLYAVACLSITGTIIHYEIWIRSSIPETFPELNIKQFAAITTHCSPEHFWGHRILFQFRGPLHNIDDDYWGYFCRDWHARKWVFAE